ncbi:MAG: hypothetical protein IKY39_04020, partial [Clostridia bacterium]|nr:hypothetical protein [Clostridia bacterium]
PTTTKRDCRPFMEYPAQVQAQTEKKEKQKSIEFSLQENFPSLFKSFVAIAAWRACRCHECSLAGPVWADGGELSNTAKRSACRFDTV